MAISLDILISPWSGPSKFRDSFLASPPCPKKETVFWHPTSRESHKVVPLTFTVCERGRRVFLCQRNSDQRDFLVLGKLCYTMCSVLSISICCYLFHRLFFGLPSLPKKGNRFFGTLLQEKAIKWCL